MPESIKHQWEPGAPYEAAEGHLRATFRCLRCKKGFLGDALDRSEVTAIIATQVPFEKYWDGVWGCVAVSETMAKIHPHLPPSWRVPTIEDFVTRLRTLEAEHEEYQIALRFRNLHAQLFRVLCADIPSVVPLVSFMQMEVGLPKQIQGAFGPALDTVEKRAQALLKILSERTGAAELDLSNESEKAEAPPPTPESTTAFGQVPAGKSVLSPKSKSPDQW